MTSEQVIDRIDRIRHEAGMTQRTLAGAAGLSYQTINAYFTGHIPHPRFTNISQMLGALGYELVIRPKVTS